MAKKKKLMTVGQLIEKLGRFSEDDVIVVSGDEYDAPTAIGGITTYEVEPDYMYSKELPLKGVVIMTVRV